MARPSISFGMAQSLTCYQKTKPSLRDPLVQAGGLAQAERLGNDQRISTSAIIAFCKRRRSASNSSSVLVGATRSKGPKMTRALENGRGRMNLSQLLALQQLEYSILIGWICAPDFWAKKMMPRPSS